MICAPAIRSDYIEPCYGADGKLHDSLASYRASLKPEGNPKGELFHEVGTETNNTFQKPKFCEKARVDDIKKAIEDVKNNRVPPPQVVSKEIE